MTTVPSAPCSDALQTGPLAFWFLNHDLEAEELKRQIGELKAKGFAGFFMHPRGGLNVPYGSEAWYEVIRICIEEARALGLEAWLYDEDPYPSGAAGGRILMEQPQYCASGLIPTVRSVAPGERVTLDLPDGELVAAYLEYADGRLERVDAAAGLVRTHWEQFHIFTAYYPPVLGAGNPHWRAEAASPHYRVRLSAPEGAQTLLCFTRRRSQQNPWGGYPDLMNPEATELFFRYTHDAYAERFGKDFGGVVPGIFTDEAKVTGAIPWSPCLPQWFEEEAGMDLFEVLPHLVLNSHPGKERLRWLFRRAVGRGVSEAFWKPMVERCRRHGLLLTGHVSPEEDPMGQTQYAPGWMAVIGSMDLPGTDLIGSTLGSAETPLGHLSPKLASSAAHASGKRWVACEAFAVCDWAHDLAAMTRATHWLYALGVNRLVTHGQYYSIDGLRKREAPASQFFQVAYWEHFAPFAAMVERLSRELSAGRHTAPVLLYYPEESFMALEGAVFQPEAEGLRERLGALVHTLVTSGYDFDFADADLLLQSRGENRQAILGQERFQAVVVPARYLVPGVWEKLQALKAEGIPVLFTEATLRLLDAAGSEVTTGAGDVLEALRQQVAPLWRSSGALLGHQRDVEGEPFLFLCNNARQRFCGEVALSFPGPYEISHPQEGMWRLAPEPLRLELGTGLGVFIRRAKSAGPSRPDEPASLPLEEWEVRFPGENCVILNEARLLPAYSPGAEENWSTWVALPPVDLVSPTILSTKPLEAGRETTLLMMFDWYGDPTPLRLVMESDLGVSDSSLFLNGQPLPEPQQKATYDIMNREVDLTPFIRQGRNHLFWRFRPSLARYPYEALRLFGAFHAAFPSTSSVPATLTPRPECYACGYPVAPAQLGHAHYGGLVEYTSHFTLEQVPEGGLSLEFGQIYESAEIFVNGKPQGILWCEPFRVNLSPESLHVGRNRLSVVASCSAANYLQAAGRPAGFLGPVRFYIPGVPAR